MLMKKKIGSLGTRLDKTSDSNRTLSVSLCVQCILNHSILYY